MNEELNENACGYLVSINDIPVDGGMSGICPLGWNGLLSSTSFILFFTLRKDLP